MPQAAAPISDRPGATKSTGLTTAICFALAVAALYAGREIFVPLALAILLSFLLSPPVGWLQRRGFPKIPAVILIVLLAFGGVGTFVVVVGGQLTQLAQNLPNYTANIQSKIRDIKPDAGPDGLLGRILDMASKLRQEVVQPGATTPSGGTLSAVEAPAVKPIPVEITNSQLSPREVITTFLGPIIAPVVTFGIVIVFVIFILLQRKDLRDRLIRLVSAGDINRTTRAMEDAGARVAKYLVMQLVVNVTYGIPIGVGLWFIGVPNALLWGLLAVVLRFIPYVGPILAALFPLALSIAVGPDWSMLLWTVALFVVLELVSNNVIEPVLYGARTGLSPIAIVIAAIFWTLLWGPVGLLLATPLTVCLVVLGHHVPQLAFLNVLLGSDPVLTPSERFYQRLLALDADEATEHAESYLEDHSLLNFFGDVATPALALVEIDRARGALDYDRRSQIVETMLTVIDNLSDYEERDEEGAASAMGSNDIGRVLCFGARGNLDDAAATILCQLFERSHVDAQALSWIDLAPANLRLIKLEGVSTAYLVYLNEDSLAHARFLIRRMRRLMPDISMHVVFLSSSLHPEILSNAGDRIRADAVSNSLADALKNPGTKVPSPAIEPDESLGKNAYPKNQTAVLASA